MQPYDKSQDEMQTGRVKQMFCHGMQQHMELVEVSLSNVVVMQVSCMVTSKVDKQTSACCLMAKASDYGRLEEEAPFGSFF